MGRKTPGKTRDEHRTGTGRTNIAGNRTANHFYIVAKQSARARRHRRTPLERERGSRPFSRSQLSREAHDSAAVRGSRPQPRAELSRPSRRASLLLPPAPLLPGPSPQPTYSSPKHPSRLMIPSSFLQHPLADLPEASKASPSTSREQDFPAC